MACSPCPGRTGFAADSGRPGRRPSPGRPPRPGRRPEMAPLLAVESTSKRFGGLVANGRVTMTVDEGEIVGLIGPNGAGKTTLFSCISGYLAPDEGHITLGG